MARDSDGIFTEKWADGGDTGEPLGLDRSEGWPIAYSQPGGNYPTRLLFNLLFLELSALAIELNQNGVGLEYDISIDYVAKAIVRGSDGNRYIATSANGPATAVKDPVGDTTGTWEQIIETIAGKNTYYPDYLEADQGITGNGKTIKAYVDTILSDNATIILRHNSSSATTTYTVGTDETIPSNIDVVIERGAILSIASAKTLNIDGPFRAGVHKVFDGNGVVSFGDGAIIQAYPQWWGAIGDGTDNAAAFQKAFDQGGLKIFLPGGTYGLSTTITKDATGFKLFGLSEGSTTIKPLSGFSGDTDSDGNDILINLGNGSTSRYFNEIRNITFSDSDAVGSICAIYLNRVNLQSKIMHCNFNLLACGVELITLALGNVISCNKFYACTNNVRFTGTAGNSTVFTNNYMAGGTVYLNNSMTDVTITHNTFDSDSGILSDGISGIRGCQISFNRFEGNTAGTNFIELGTNRGTQITNNYFTGTGIVLVAINFTSSAAIQNAVVSNNHYERIVTSFIKSVMIANALTTYGNTYDLDTGDATTPYDTLAMQMTIGEAIASTDDIVRIKEDETRLGETQNVITKYINAACGASTVATDSFTVTVPATSEGGYTCIIEGMVAFVPNSTATAVMAIKSVLSHTNGNDGGDATSAVSEVYQTDSAATASGTRDITDVEITAVETSDTVLTVQTTATYSGTGTPTATYKITLIWWGYSEIPTIN